MSGYQKLQDDWSTYGSASRALPENVQQASNDTPLEERDMFSQEDIQHRELEELGESIPIIGSCTHRR